MLDDINLHRVFLCLFVIATSAMPPRNDSIKTVNISTFNFQLSTLNFNKGAKLFGDEGAVVYNKKVR